MGFSLNIMMNQSFYDKTNPELFHRAEIETIRNVVMDAEEECRRECPVKTGFLRDSHYTIFQEDSAKIINTAEYAPDVIYGTKNRSPNDYPQRALNNLSGSYESSFIDALTQAGVVGI